MKKLIERFIKPVDNPSGGSPLVLYATYGENKKTKYNDQFVYPILDSKIKSETQPYLNLTFGKKCINELYPSFFIEEKLSVIEFLFSLFYIDKFYFRDFRFIWNIYFSILAYSDRGWGKMNKRAKYYHFIRVFFGHRYLFFKYRNLVCSSVKKVYVTQYYNVRMLALVRICNTRKIPVFDVQHGYIGEDHPAYDKSLSLETLCKPSGFYVFDNDAAEYVKKYTDSLIEISNWMHLHTFNNFQRNKNLPPRVLFSVQWGTPLPANELVTMINKYSHVNWVFRMHPLETAERSDLESVFSLKNVTIEESGVNLVESLLQSDIHLTWNSSLCFEAEQLGVPSYFISPKDIIRFVDSSGIPKKLITYLPLDDFEPYLSPVLKQK